MTEQELELLTKKEYLKVCNTKTQRLGQLLTKLIQQDLACKERLEELSKNKKYIASKAKVVKFQEYSKIVEEIQATKELVENLKKEVVLVNRNLKQSVLEASKTENDISILELALSSTGKVISHEFRRNKEKD